MAGLCAHAQQDSTTMQSVALDNVVVTAHRYTSSLRPKSDGSMLWDMSMMEDLPKIMGNADPIHFSQMLPGIQTNNEYQSGVHMQGCENGHNAVCINGVPIYNVCHLLGFFSIFNAPHFTKMHIDKSTTQEVTLNRLGGMFNMLTPTEHPDSTDGELAVGLISSQATLHTPLNSNTALHLSARASYLNLLYGDWLKMDEGNMRYSFYDVNLSLTHRINPAHMLLADFYAGRDNAGVDTGDEGADLKDKWGNVMGALHWIYDRSKTTLHTTLYTTACRNRLSIQLGDINYQLPSSITDVALRVQLKHKWLETGMHSIYHHIVPQNPQTESNLRAYRNSKMVQDAYEHTAYANGILHITPHLRIKAGAAVTAYTMGDDTHHCHIDPQACITLDKHHLLCNVTAYSRHQYVMQTGFSDAGLPTEFWMACNELLPPQYVQGVNASATLYLWQRRYSITAEAFYKRIGNQQEYQGSILDCINANYSLYRQLERGYGHNHGVSVMINKCSGALTGWIDIAYTQAQRKSGNEPGTRKHPASHERPLEINAVATWQLSEHWSLGGCLVYASGTPFTAPVALSIINGNIISQYGEYNSNRLKPYRRVDASANYKWHTKHLKECGINLSVYNLLGQQNDLFYYNSVNRKDHFFQYKPARFIARILPSLSFFCKF
ncbi:MAG: TonB-dependent receptor plug domain-containing protein [Prevotella sp.]